MSIRLKLQWLLLILFSLITLLGSGGLWLVHTPVQQMRLRPGEKIHVRIYRPFPAPLSMQLSVTPDDGPAHLLERRESEGMLASLCVSANGQDGRWAICQPHGFGPQHATFRLIPQNGKGFQLEEFCTDVTLSVISCADSALGGRGDLYINSPVPFKFTPQGKYEMFWWFHFWPAYALLLGLYLTVLIVLTGRQKKRA